MAAVARTHVFDTVAEEIDKVGHADGPAEWADEASGQSAADAAEVDVRVRWARACESLNAELGRAAEQWDEVCNGCEHWIEREVVAADGDDEDVARRDAAGDQPVLRQQRAARTRVEGRRLHCGVKTEDVEAAPLSLQVEPVTDVQLHRRRL